MHIFVLAAVMLLVAAVLWYNQTSGAAEKTPPPEMDMDRRLRQTLAEHPRMVDTLAESVRALEAVMVHPELGGPGFLLVQFPSTDQGEALVTAQYPNIREALYRRIVRRELDRVELAEAGVPETLLSRAPDFETESGGVVVLSVHVKGIPPEFTESLNSRRDRGIALGILVEAMAANLPQFSIRVFGTDLLLTPDRECVAAPTT